MLNEANVSKVEGDLKGRRRSRNERKELSSGKRDGTVLPLVRSHSFPTRRSSDLGTEESVRSHRPSGASKPLTFKE